MPWTPPSVSELRNRIRIIRTITERSDDGTVTDYDSERAIRPAKIEWTSGEEIEQGSGQTAMATKRISFRYVDGLTTKDHIRLGARRFDILAIDDWEERHLWHIIKAKEVV